MCHGHCGSGCLACKIIAGLVALVFTLTSVAAFVGVYVTHVTVDGWSFGTLNGSVALATLIVSLAAWLKTVKKLCPCNSKGGCGCGDARGGGCPGCGRDSCQCA